MKKCNKRKRKRRLSGSPKQKDEDYKRQSPYDKTALDDSERERRGGERKKQKREKRTERTR